MDRQLFYTTNIQTLQQKLDIFLKKKSRLAWLRFFSVAAIFAAFFFLWSVNHLYSFGGAFIIMVIFVQLILADLKNK